MGCIPRFIIQVSNWWGTSWRTSLAYMGYQTFNRPIRWKLDKALTNQKYFVFGNRPKRELLIPKSFEPEERPMNFRKGTNWTISRDALWPFIGLFSNFPSPSKSSMASKSALPTPKIWIISYDISRSLVWLPRTIWSVQDRPDSIWVWCTYQQW